jgi:SAM-dependent methyltransferase
MTESYFARLSQESPAVRLQHLIAGYWVSQAVAVAAQVGLADLLADGPRPTAELAEATGAHPRALYRLLRALAGVGVFTEVEPGSFGLTPMAELLRSDAPASLRGMAVYLCGDEHWRAWGHLGYSVRTGHSAFEHLFGTDPWEYRARHPETNAAFNAFMTGLVTQLADAVAAAYDFSGMRAVVDVGGSHGALLVAILRANPGVRGVLFDLPHVAEGAKARLGAAGLSDRCEVVGGDMFEGVPEGGDAYILSRVIHDWDEDRSVAILQQCHRAIAPGGKLLLAEEVIPPGDAPSYGKLSDLNMLVSPGGQERTEAEYRALYEAAGFTLTRVIPTRSRVSVVEGTPA